MPDLGETIYPRHCRVSVSADKAKLALTFQFQDRAPLTVVLPLLGAAGLSHRLAQCLHLLGVRPVKPAEEAPAANASVANPPGTNPPVASSLH